MLPGLSILAVWLGSDQAAVLIRMRRSCSKAVPDKQSIVMKLHRSRTHDPVLRCSTKCQPNAYSTAIGKLSITEHDSVLHHSPDWCLPLAP